MASVIGFDNPNNTTSFFNSNPSGGSIDPTSDVVCDSVTCNDITANNEVILNTVDVKDSVVTINSGNPSNSVAGALLFESKTGTINHSGLCRATDGTHYIVADTDATINGATDVTALTRGNLTLNRIDATEEHVTSSYVEYGNVTYFNATGNNSDPVAHLLGGVSGVNISEGPLTVAGGLMVTGGTSWINGASGLGIEAGLSVGSMFGGAIVANDTNDSTDVDTGSIITDGGVGVAKGMTIGGVVKITSDTYSSDSLSGALVVSGGVGIAKNLYAKHVVVQTGSFQSTIDSNATGTGALVIKGGLSIDKTIRAGGACVVNDYISSNKTSDATDSLSGSLILVGGAGISKKVYVGDGIYLPSSGGTASKLNYYEELTHTTNYAGAVSISNVSYKITRIGNVVYITIPYATATAGSSTNNFYTDTAIPLRFRPSTGKYFYCEVNSNASFARGYCNLSNGGTFTFYKWDNSNFPMGNYAGTYSTGISYVLD